MMEGSPIAKDNYHSNTDINGAILYGVACGWCWVQKGNGHTVGYLYCMASDLGKHRALKCFIPVYGSPKSPTNHAKKIRKAIDCYFC